MTDKQCVICGKGFSSRNWKAKTCGDECSKALRRSRYLANYQRLIESGALTCPSQTAMPQKTRDQIGKCQVCGRPTSAGSHLACSKSIEARENQRLASGVTVAQARDKAHRGAVKNYRKGKLPPWMYS